jgi:hypothetical protein
MDWRVDNLVAIRPFDGARPRLHSRLHMNVLQIGGLPRYVVPPVGRYLRPTREVTKATVIFDRRHPDGSEH